MGMRNRNKYPRPSALPEKPLTRFGAVAQFFLTWGGVIYVVFMLNVITIFARFYACTDVYGEEYCSQLNGLALFIYAQMLGNLGLFLWFSRENKVEHWQRNSVVASLCRSAIEDELNDSMEEGDAEEMRDAQQDLTDSPHDPHLCPPDNAKPSWGKFCVECQRDSPIRSHHCPLCHQCVLRKDHHCYITGACVGLGNQRYFIVFLFWAVVGCMIGTRYILLYLNKQTPWYPFGWLTYIAPVSLFKWLILQDTPPSQVAVCVIISFSVGSCMGALGFFVAQIFYTLHGYTMYEYHSLSIREAYPGDGESVGERMRLVFGPYYLLNFIFPTFWWKQRLTPEIADNLFRVRSKLL